MTMGERIKQLRKSHNMSQEELGNILGVQKTAIFKYEKGMVENIPRESVLKMAAMFNVTPEYILAYTDNEKATFVSETMAQLAIIEKYGNDVFKLLEMFELMTNTNQEKFIELGEYIIKAQRYDSAASMFK